MNKCLPLQPVFELRAFVDSNHEAPLRVKGPATLSYHLKNTTITRTQLPAQLHYQVMHSWMMLGATLRGGH